MKAYAFIDNNTALGTLLRGSSGHKTMPYWSIYAAQGDGLILVFNRGLAPVYKLKSMTMEIGHKTLSLIHI